MGSHRVGPLLSDYHSHSAFNKNTNRHRGTDLKDDEITKQECPGAECQLEKKE